MNTAVREVIWIGISVAVSVGLLGLVLVVGGAADDYFGDSAIVRLSVAMGAWPLPASLMTLVLARAMLGVGPRPGLLRALAVGGMGALASAVCAAALVTWTENHFGGLFDPEFVGPTLWLPLLVGVLTVAITLALALSGRPAAFALALVLGTSTLIGVLALLNLPGLLDGISESGILLITAFAAAGMVITIGFGSLLLTRPREAIH